MVRTQNTIDGTDAFRWTGVPPVLLMLTLVLSSLNFIGCSGGGDGGGSGGPLPASGGTASGRLLVPPSQTVEREPNDTISQAQQVTATTTVAGQAANGDTGFVLPETPTIEVADLYRLNVLERVQITLAIAEDNPVANDLDLFLLDAAGNVVNDANDVPLVSQGLVSTEVLETPAGGGEFLIGVRAFQGASAYVLALTDLADLTNLRAKTPQVTGRFVPGDILVKMREDKLGGQAQATSLATRHGLTPVKTLSSGARLMQVTLPLQAARNAPAGAKFPLPGSDVHALQALTLDTIQRLQADPQVAYAEPNFLRQPFLTPNDEFFSAQWHYSLINLPEAWNTTIGDEEVIVAVIDTGVLSNHPDLRARLIDGYDFVSNLVNASDGDGIDDDPSDPGDDPRARNNPEVASSSFHGTHVTGTVGAVSNNIDGVAGVTWSTRIMPLRVLGVSGGADADIAEAIRYAAGLSNASGTVPAERADIINMSLGGPDGSQTVQNAVTAARAQGVSIVAAAGNANNSVLQFPASHTGVISVAAVDLNSARAPYSSFGSAVDVAAPGGDTRVDLNGDGFVDGVLSTLGTDVGEFTFRFYDGTSMASPHVAGVLALMQAVNPDLTPADIDLLLAGTHPATSRRITRDLGAPGRDNFFGHGLIDAAAAVVAAGEVPGGGGPEPVGSILAISTVALNFDNFLDELTFDVTNAGIDTLAVTEITADVPWLTLTSTFGTAPLTVIAQVDRAGLADGVHTATIRITTDATQPETAATVMIDVSVRVGGNTIGNVGTVFILVVDPDTFATVAQVTTDVIQDYAFTTPAVPEGSYLIIAGTDRDNDNFICDIGEDACGTFPDAVTVVDGENTAGIEFVVGDSVSPQRAQALRVLRDAAPFRRLE